MLCMYIYICMCMLCIYIYTHTHQQCTTFKPTFRLSKWDPIHGQRVDPLKHCLKMSENLRENPWKTSKSNEHPMVLLIIFPAINGSGGRIPDIYFSLFSFTHHYTVNITRRYPPRRFRCCTNWPRCSLNFN